MSVIYAQVFSLFNFVVRIFMIFRLQAPSEQNIISYLGVFILSFMGTCLFSVLRLEKQ